MIFFWLMSSLRLMVSLTLVMFVNICEFRRDCIFTVMDCFVMEYIGELKLSLKNCATAGLLDLVHSAIKSSLFSSINLCKSLSEELSLFKSTAMQGTKSDFILRVSEEEFFIISSNTRASSFE